MSDEQQTSHLPDHPGVRVPPPILLIVVVLVGYSLQQAWALELPNWSGWSGAGWGLIGVGLAILITGWVQFYRAKTNILHHKPSSNVIQSGLYRFSRNPIYVSGLLLQLGIALLSNNLWIVLLVPVSKLALDRYVIAREEAYLERAFGEVYVDYKRTIRRWL
jgi:protein-S-isoprenylcysteine O-methyltransferase Ste14